MKNNLLRLAIVGLLFSGSTVPVVALAEDVAEMGDSASALETSISESAVLEPAADNSTQPRETALPSSANDPSSAGGLETAGEVESGQVELPLPTFYAIDADTAQPIVGVRVNIVVRNAETGEVLDQTEESVGIQSGGLSEELYKYLQNYLYPGWREVNPEPISLEVSTVSVPFAYGQSEASGTVTETNSGW